MPETALQQRIPKAENMTAGMLFEYQSLIVAILLLLSRLYGCASASLFFNRLCSARPKCGSGYSRRKTYRFSIFQISVNRCHDDASFDSDQIDTNQRNAYPRIHDDTFVENTIKYVY
jgi:hypothetical protein